jgi:hypothetical protein
MVKGQNGFMRVVMMEDRLQWAAKGIEALVQVILLLSSHNINNEEVVNRKNETLLNKIYNKINKHTCSSKYFNKNQ